MTLSNFLGIFDFTGAGIMEKLRGNRTYLIVLALIVINFVSSDTPVSLDVLQDSLMVGLVGTMRAGLAKVGFGGLPPELLKGVLEGVVGKAKGPGGPGGASA